MKRAVLFAAWSALAVALSVVATSSAADKNKKNNDNNSGNSSQVDDKTFAQKASAGNLAEINMGRLAVQKGQSAQVKQYGERLVRDHTMANTKLNAILNKESIPAATTMSQKHEECWKKLAAMNGQDFDHKFVEEMIKDHKQDVKLFQNEAQHGQNSALKQYAEQTLPVIQEHLKMAQNLSGNNSGNNSGSKTSGGSAGSDNNNPRKAGGQQEEK